MSSKVGGEYFTIKIFKFGEMRGPWIAYEVRKIGTRIDTGLQICLGE